MNFGSVLSYVGSLLQILGILFILPVFFSWIYADNMHTGFFIGAVLSFVIGLILDRRYQKDELGLSEAMVIAALAFLIVSVIGAIPYMFQLSPLDSWFESTSGFTTTGLTMIEPEGFPVSLLFWRALTQWIGGVGILIIFLLLVSSPGMSSYYLYKAEGGSGMIEAGVRSTVRKVMIIYATYTAIGFALFWASGMHMFEALLNSITGIATGGFTTRNASIGAFQNPMIELVAIMLMILGATSFFVHARLWNGKLRNYIKNPETRLFWSIILIFGVLVSLSYISSPEPLRHGVFMTFSALTGTGFANTEVLAGSTKVLLIVLMVIGGYAGSTAGGLKLIRSGIILKSLPWLGRKISLPQEAVVPLKFGGKIIKEGEQSIISIFALIYLIIMVLSALGLTFLGYSPIDSFFTVASAEGTVGLTVFPIAEMVPAGKLILIANMFLGRLEIIPFLAILYMIFEGLLGVRKGISFGFMNKFKRKKKEEKHVEVHAYQPVFGEA